MEAGAGTVPEAVAVGGRHAERVVAGRQLRVVGAAPIAGVDPVGVEPLQTVFECGSLRHQQTECGVLKLPLVASGRHFDAVRQRQGDAIDQDALEVYRGRVGVAPDVLRVDSHDVVDARKPQHAVGRTAPGGCVAAIEFHGTQPVEQTVHIEHRRSIVRERRIERRRRDGHQPLVGGQPEMVGVVLEDLQNGLAQRTAQGRERGHPAVLPDGQTIRRAEPQQPAGIFEDRNDPIPGEAIPAAQMLRGIGGDDEQAVGLGAHPDSSRAILVDEMHGCPRRSRQQRLHGTHVAILDAVEPLAGADPEPSARVLHQCGHGVSRQPVAPVENFHPLGAESKDAGTIGPHP